MNKLGFEDINLSEEILKAVYDMGFEEMSPIQSKAIPKILEGVDIIGQAQTGTGKTAAFGIPIIEKTDEEDRCLQSLVLCPTRELSIQVAEEIRRLAKYKKNIFVLPIYGGQPIERQIKALKKGIQIVVGTPGRIIDHIRRKTLKLGNIKMLILDEADEMFDMGFRDDIELIINQVPEERQTIFFSATMPKEIVDFATRYQNNPEIIRVVPKELTVPRVEQYFFELKEHMKTEILSRLIDIYNPRLSIVFCNTKKKVDELTIELQGRGYFVDGLHGDLKQAQRDKVMQKFRTGNIDVLVATDVAARGLDIDDVDIVFNYDIPQDEEYYVHRIGRTARAGRKGIAFSFVVGKDKHRIKVIERYTKTKIARRDLPTLKDVEERQIHLLLEKIKEEVDKGQLDKYERMVNEILEQDYTSFDIAAALLKLYFKGNKLGEHRELDAVDYSKKSVTDLARIYINVGRKKGVSPRHILGALLNETGIPKKSVGEIDMYDKFTFVDIPEDYIGKVIKGLNNKRIKGIKVKVELANIRD
ncbi:DEAD/DEAH box helicase [Tepidimicrobium xylanilyticum]|uniref:ATP-dependent RNA helicase CshA n=1 Tax=Tepidimicrobium xylanilyticum TaxID=1123352 RepID=A0A1H2X6M0_9FIRM|nr:DEAD/DEAH box helicase [Tepidimicrobium xylanilyticum]GMG97413.1 RNA helicase [Tepidimicrobium xylanilyticum]SDW88427.1 ATP-dependent RNA helicase DeaD [Tepidimicrobium xylanilyticum]